MNRIGVFSILVLLVSLLPWQNIAQTSAVQETPKTQVEEDPPLATYKTFANALARGHFAEARTHAIGQALAMANQKESNKDQNKGSVGEGTAPQFMVLAEKRSEDGSVVTLNAMQIVQPSGQEGMFKPPILHRQDATVLKTGFGWRVNTFRDRLEKCCLP
ncbi:MAG: hypothetical protein HQL75_08285 [Magnetococcales bacterium]|nr:hypothetical protein [Magnetococcales bacterium]